MPKRSLLILGLLSLSCHVSLAPSYAAPLRIGVVLGLSGPAAYWSEYQYKGMQLAVSEAQAKGVDVKLLLEDSKTEPMQPWTRMLSPSTSIILKRDLVTLLCWKVMQGMKLSGLSSQPG